MKTIEERVTILENSLNNLKNSFLETYSNDVNTKGKLDSTANGLDQTGEVVEKNQADIDYIAMMTDVELPE